MHGICMVLRSISCSMSRLKPPKCMKQAGSSFHEHHEWPKCGWPNVWICIPWWSMMRPLFWEELVNDCRSSCSSTRPGTAKSWLLSLLAVRHLSHNFGHLHRDGCRTAMLLQGNRGLPGYRRKSRRAQSMGDLEMMEGTQGWDSRFASHFHRFSSPSRMEGGAIVVVSPGLGQGVNQFQLHYIESISGILKIVQEWSGWNNQLKIRQTLQTLSSNPSSSWRRAGSDKTSNASWTSLNFWAASSARSTFLHFGQVHNKALWTALCVAFSFHFTPKFGKVPCKTQHQKWCSTCCRMLPWILSGCHFRAIFRYAFLMSAAEAPKSMPRMA